MSTFTGGPSTATRVVYILADSSSTSALSLPTVGLVPSVDQDTQFIDAFFAEAAWQRLRLPPFDGPPHLRFEHARPSAIRHLKARHGFQQMARLPNYRGARSR